MHFSPCFESSSQCHPSPDGMLVATFLNSGSVIVRDARTLETINVVQPTPTDAFTSQATLAWSPSGARLLLSGTDKIRVFSASDGSTHASINNTSHGGKEPACVRFGAHDDEVLVFSAFGLKVMIFDLSTSEAVQISNPRFHQSSTVDKGYCINRSDGHLALLTRTGGRDAVSIHEPRTRNIGQSWHPQTMSAGGMIWTPDTHWVLLWDSPASGHCLLVHTPDGQLFREVDGTRLGLSATQAGQPGIKHVQLNADGTLCAIGDHSRVVRIVNAADLWRLESSLCHPISIVPKDTLQVWQEQLFDDGSGVRAARRFVRASQVTSPSFEARNASDLRVGCSLAAFDSSGSLLATRLDDSPCTLWIWDIAAAELRAVLMFHASVMFSWHPHVHELLLVTSQDEAHRGLTYVWDPLSQGPQALGLEEKLPSGKVSGKCQALWIASPDDMPRLFLSDDKHFLLAAVTDSEPYPQEWPMSQNDGDLTSLRHADLDDEDQSVLEDTFSFKKV